MRPFCGRAPGQRRWRLKRMGIIAPRLKELKLIGTPSSRNRWVVLTVTRKRWRRLWKAQLLADLADLDVLSTEEL
ncbi:hypothetical protein MF573_05480 [Klebsiella pneumoniae]|nr:hypothetical protein MF573_05480 [Klebsiella pneumoniae]